jgi:putative PIN family toxin of toxin-antitoxin system
VLLRGALARTQSLTARLYEAWRADQFVLLVSEPILAEVDAVTARPELWRKLRVTPREARAVPRRLRRRAVLVRPDVTIRMSRDPTDDKFLECAVSGGADYVVSADADLLSPARCAGSRSSTRPRSGDGSPNTLISDEPAPIESAAPRTPR